MKFFDMTGRKPAEDTTQAKATTGNARAAACLFVL
jgi:hypothetical protein